jgi:chromosome partitioning protein
VAKEIAIATHKGGTGKTVTAMALGAALALAKHRTLLVDLDPQGHTTIGIGIELTDNDPTIHDLFGDSPRPIGQIIRETHLPYLYAVPSSIRLARLTQLLYARPRREEILKRALSPVLDQYDFILIDCPPSLGVLTETAIAAADIIIIPCQMEARAADGLVDLLEVISIIKGEDFENWRIVLTRVDPRKSITNQAVRAALACWEHKILKTFIPQSEPMNQAQIARTDIFSYEPKSAGAIAYQALARELVKAYGNKK